MAFADWTVSELAFAESTFQNERQTLRAATEREEEAVIFLNVAARNNATCRGRNVAPHNNWNWALIWFFYRPMASLPTIPELQQSLFQFLFRVFRLNMTAATLPARLYRMTWYT